MVTVVKWVFRIKLGSSFECSEIPVDVTADDEIDLFLEFLEMM